MNTLSPLKILLAAVALTLSTNLPAAAQARIPATGESVECPVVSYREGAANVVQCTGRWQGMIIPDPVVNGHSGFMFCGPLTLEYVCETGAPIIVKDHPEPIANGLLTCVADWGAHEDTLLFTCTQ
jgi:hypothetical protein